MTRIDHLVVAAHDLAQGIDYLRSTLGIEIPPGGFHQTMGTHNHLMKLGDEIYLELISINPEAEIPQHPRWFALDEQMMRASLRQSPRLITWMVNTPDILRLTRQSSFATGTISSLTRNNLHWKVTLSDDGRLLANGLLPQVIEWQSTPHPAHAMADLGCRLHALDLYHNRLDWLHVHLKSLNAFNLVTLHEISDSESPYLAATIKTGNGLKVLSSLI